MSDLSDEDMTIWRSGYDEGIRDAVKFIEAKATHYGEGYERLLLEVRDCLNLFPNS